MIWDGWNAVMGMNARNERIAKDNPLAAIRLVDDKHRTKEALIRAGAPVVPTLSVIRNRRQLSRLAWSRLPDAWALKPNRSLGGNGIVVAVGRSQEGWRKASGQLVNEAELSDHIRCILDGEFSPRDRDWALFEPLIRTHRTLSEISYRGLPDIRVICDKDRPVLAMVRLPTATSDGRANLHQGAIGAALDLGTGVVTQARWQDRPIERHPDTGMCLIGVTVPWWGTVIDAARCCAKATGLRYLGADIVIDHQRGPIILEVNARPGLEIQNVNRLGLAETLERRPRLLQSERGSASSKLGGLLASAAILAGGIALSSAPAAPSQPDTGVQIVDEEMAVTAELQEMVVGYEPHIEDDDSSTGDRRDSDDGTEEDDHTTDYDRDQTTTENTADSSGHDLDDTDDDKEEEDTTETDDTNDDSAGDDD